MDHSCQDFAFDPGHNVSDPWELCGMLSKSLPFVESDLFIMVSLRDSVISRYRARSDQSICFDIEMMHHIKLRIA